MTRILVVKHEADAGIGLVGERIEQAGAEMVVVGPETGLEGEPLVEPGPVP